MLRYNNVNLSTLILDKINPILQGWYDGHPEIGKMQKDIFDDIFDTTDDGQTDDDDPEPVESKAKQ